MASRLPLGLRAVGVLFAAGMFASGTSSIVLSLDRANINAVWWRLNSEAGLELRSLGMYGVILMLGVCAACAVACVGLVHRHRWGYYTALVMLAVNVVSDVVNALWRGDLRTLVGVPIGLALLVYLRRESIRTVFRER